MRTFDNDVYLDVFYVKSSLFIWPISYDNHKPNGYDVQMICLDLMVLATMVCEFYLRLTTH